jgi:hypothetical protein
MNDTEKATISGIIKTLQEMIAETTVPETGTNVSTTWTGEPFVSTSTDALAYTKDDKTPRLIPDTPWLIAGPNLSMAPYLQDLMWWLLEEQAKAAGEPIVVLLGCPLDTALDDSPAHRPCNEPGGGMMADVKYPSIDGKLDVAKMKAIIEKFLAICCPKYPADDCMNESEIRVGGDVAALTGRYGGTRNYQVDDAQHHRFDDTVYPHFHIKWKA